MKYLVTGGSGSIGSELVKKLLTQQPLAVRVFSNSEEQLHAMSLELEHPALRFLHGDVRDYDRVKTAMRDIDVVYHAAAMKHVPACEYNPFEAVQTNVIGTQNIIQAAIEREVQAVVLVSTDKAAGPTNTMGATKLLAEKLMQASAKSSPTRLVTVRFGNVIGARGSVIPQWVDSIKRGFITITNPDMTRFIMTKDEAVDLILAATGYESGTLNIIRMPFVRLGTLAEVFFELVCDRLGMQVREI
jgi:FlaA1/EpsC-like NDP-sugar epimerase